MKRAVSFLIVTLCMVFLFSSVCYADSLKSGDWLYELKDDGTVSITGYEGKETDVVVPGLIDGRTVTELGDKAFSGNEKLESVKLPDTIIRIGDDAFKNCVKLEEVVLSKTLAKLGDSAFKGCKELEVVLLPETVTRIGDEAFKGCEKLLLVNLPKALVKIGDDAFKGCSKAEVSVVVGSYAETYMKQHRGEVAKLTAYEVVAAKVEETTPSVYNVSFEVGTTAYQATVNSQYGITALLKKEAGQFVYTDVLAAYRRNNVAYTVDALSGPGGSFIARISNANQEAKYRGESGVNDVFSISVTGNGTVANVMKETSVTVRTISGFETGNEYTVYTPVGNVEYERQSLTQRTPQNQTTAYETNAVVYAEPDRSDEVWSASRYEGSTQRAEGTVTAEWTVYTSNGIGTDGMDAAHQETVMEGSSFETADDIVSQSAESVTTEQNRGEPTTRTEEASQLDYDDAGRYTGWDWRWVYLLGSGDLELLDSYSVTEYAIDAEGNWSSTSVELTNLSVAAGAPAAPVAEDTRFKPDGTAAAPSVDVQTPEEMVGADVTYVEAELSVNESTGEVEAEVEQTISGEIVTDETTSKPVIETDEGETIALTEPEVEPEVEAALDVLNPADGSEQAEAMEDEEEKLKKLKRKQLLDGSTDDVEFIEEAATTEAAPDPAAPDAPANVVDTALDDRAPGSTTG